MVKQTGCYLLIKRVANCLPIWEGQVQRGEVKICSWEFVCITFFRVEEKENLMKQSYNFGTPCVSNRRVSWRCSVYGNKCRLLFYYDSSQNFGVFVNSKRGTGNHCFLDLIISEQFSHRNLSIYTECDQLYCHKTFLNFS